MLRLLYKKYLGETKKYPWVFMYVLPSRTDPFDVKVGKLVDGQLRRISYSEVK